MIIEKEIEKFNNFPVEFRAEIDNDFVYQKIQVLEKKFDINLSVFVIILSVFDGKDEELINFLQVEYDLKEKKAEKILKIVREDILDPITIRLKFILWGSEFKIKERQKFIEEIFKENILEELNKPDFIKERINKQIFSVLSEDLKFKDNLAHIIHKSKEEILRYKVDSAYKILNVTEFLDTFIKEQGSGMINDIDIINFVLKSEFVKGITEKDKNNLLDILKIYRNIKFFPMSMPSDDGRGWEIMPLSYFAEDITEVHTVLGPPKTKGEENVEDLEEESAKYKKDSLQKMVLDEEIEREHKLEELRFAMKNFAPGSLERKALEEEEHKLKI